MRGINFAEDWSWSNAPRFGGGSQPSGNTTTTQTQTSTPWSGEQPSLMQIYNQAGQNFANAVPQYYPNSTYTPLTSTQNQYIKQIQDITAGGGTPQFNSAFTTLTNLTNPDSTAGTINTFNQGQNVLANELDPSYLNPWNSPSFGTVVNNTLASAVPAASNSFIGGNRSDSGLANRATTMAATDAVGNLAQGQYQANQAIQNNAQQQAASDYLTQQGNQLKAISMMPQFDQQTIGNLGTGLATGGLTQQDWQNQLDADMQRYNYGQMLPWNQLQLFENAITGTGNPGGQSTGTTTQPFFNNQGANIMGGISSIGGLGVGIAGLVMM